MCSLGGESLWMQHDVISSHPCSAQTEWHHGYIMWTTHHLGAIIIIIMGYTLTDYFEKCHERERKSPEISSSLPSLLPSYPPLLIHLGWDINQSPHQWWEYISHTVFISEYIPPVLHFAVSPPILKTNKWIQFSHQNHLDWWDGMRCDFWKLSLNRWHDTQRTMRKISHLTILLMAGTWCPSLPFSSSHFHPPLLSCPLWWWRVMRWREVCWLHLIHCKGNWQRSSSSFKLPSGCHHLTHFLLHVTGNMEKMDGEKEDEGEDEV